MTFSHERRAVSACERPDDEAASRGRNSARSFLAGGARSQGPSRAASMKARGHPGETQLREGLILRALDSRAQPASAGRNLRPVFAIHTKGPRDAPRKPPGARQCAVLNKFQFKREGERGGEEGGGSEMGRRGYCGICIAPDPPSIAINELLIPPSECRTTNPLLETRRDMINPLCPDSLSPASLRPILDTAPANPPCHEEYRTCDESDKRRKLKGPRDDAFGPIPL